MIQQLAGEALQLEQVDDVLFVHAGRVLIDAGAVSSIFCRDRPETARKEGSPLPRCRYTAGARGAIE